MADDIVIRSERLGKKYVIGHEAQRERYVALRDVIARGARNAWRIAADMVKGRIVVPGDTVEEFWALKGVSFEVKRGEVLGIIGRNGAGKSTLLKILSRITEPTEGRVTIKGRVASLLEVGTGFHPELTGRENIYLNGAVLGMTRAEIKRKFDEIVAFAEVEKFLDTPVKRYSSGMYVRLAFAVAAHLEPEILVVDEVLAVGDAEFQKKCLGRMQDVAGHGRTVLFVSHNMGAVSSLCRTCILLKNGSIEEIGPATKVSACYAAQSTSTTMFRSTRKYAAPISIERVESATTEVNGTGLKLELRLGIRADRELKSSIDVRLKDAVGVPVGFSSLGALDQKHMISFEAGYSEIVMETILGEIAEGNYLVSLDLTVPNAHYFQRLEDCLSLQVTRNAATLGRRPHEQSWGLGSVYFNSSLVSQEKEQDAAGLETYY